MIRLINNGIGTFQCNAGDRVAQLVVIPCILNGEKSSSLSDSDRGEKGFGSSGAK